MTGAGLAGEHALVIGAGIAGLVTACSIADRFERVTLVERDRLPDGPSLRARTPQAAHSHILGPIGYRMLDGLLPGLDDDLEAAGAPKFDYLEDRRLFAGRWAPRIRSGLMTRSCTRALLEWRIRERMLARHSNVAIVAGRVVGLLAADHGARIRGVRDDQGGSTRADLVVDATGPGSQMPRWLRELGLAPVTIRRLDLRGGMVSRLYRPLHPDRHPWTLLVVLAVPGNPRSAALARVEGGRWRLSMSNLGRPPPRDPEGFLDFVRRLPATDVHDAIADAEPESDIHYYGRLSSSWPQYHTVERFPAGLVVLGSAAFDPNPEHAQGMTFCLMAAERLARLLASVAAGELPTPALSQAFQRETAELFESYWHWNAAADLPSPRARSEPYGWADRTLHAYYRFVRRGALDDPHLTRAVAETTHGARRPESLLEPGIALRALWRRATEHGATAHREDTYP